MHRLECCKKLTIKNTRKNVKILINVVPFNNNTMWCMEAGAERNVLAFGRKVRFTIHARNGIEGAKRKKEREESREKERMASRTVPALCPRASP
ncbi:hypothetical protein M0804_006373 [Polistes exclamans]|nr:hypothetical protein M0804_006373 [Polistes exclamans]